MVLKQEKLIASFKMIFNNWRTIVLVGIVLFLKAGAIAQTREKPFEKYGKIREPNEPYTDYLA